MNAASFTTTSNASDYLNTTAIFGAVRKTILSKDFKGGKVNNVFGETVLDFSGADISGLVVLDISQAFGEISLIVPANWQVEFDITQFFAATRDTNMDTTQVKKGDKVLVVTGNSVFAALNISNA